MILTLDEKRKIFNLGMEIYTTGSGINEPPLQIKGIATEPWLVKMKISNNIYLKIKIACDYNDYQLYVNNMKIRKSEDGPWWDSVRSEIPKYEQGLIDYHENVKLEELRKARDRDIKRMKELQRAEDYINGWRWWKFWWNRK